MTTGEVIRRIRKSLGMTQSELGAVLGYTQPAISQLEHDGAAVHDVRVLRRVAKALQVPLAILVVESNEEADVNRRNFLRTGAIGAGATVGAGAMQRTNTEVSAAGAGRIGAADIAEIQRSVSQLHELDLIVGGDRLCYLAAGQTRYVQQLLDGGSYSDDAGRVLASTAAEMMTAAGWVHYEAGHLDQARRYYADAAQAATTADDGIAGSHALLNAGVLNYQEKARHREGIHLVEAAQSAASRRGGPRLRALGAIREAEASGAAGDRAAMTKAINRAYHAYESGHGYDPGWVFLPPAELHGLTGMAYMQVGDHRRATSHLQTAIDESVSWPRERAHWRIRSAENLVKAGEIAEGCSMLTTNFHEFDGLTSTRLWWALGSIERAVRPHLGVPEVREFLGMVAEKV
ncbi:helix-turn-helix domain-containing protein [Nocardia sp. BMG51109]|uniref:helix-turn-helix domain-containing protein n=1 Tax=Nocardia sp. BMG51109 TaxID=1056816 RepID=UPI0018DDBDC6|nr:helix-turn-helix transcriptional regulator [Nocardia sp. BMG51109]